MTTQSPGIVEFHRPARVFPHPLPSSPIRIASPPTVLTSNQGSILQIFLPMVGSASMIGFALLYDNQTFLYIALGVAALMMIAGIAMRVQAKRQVKKQRRQNSEKYRAYLSDLEERLEQLTKAQAETALHQNPGIDGIWSLVNEGTRVWERRPADADFMRVRLGTGRVPLVSPLTLELGDDPLVEYEPELLEEARRLHERYKVLPQSPVTVSLSGMGVLAVTGEPEAARAWVRSALCGIASLHAPDDVRVLSFFPPSNKDEWTWLKWLPHARDAVEPADNVQLRVALAIDPGDFEVLLSQLIRPRIDHVERLRAEKMEQQVRFQQAVVVIDQSEPSDVTSLPVYDEMLRKGSSIGVLAIVLVPEADRTPGSVGARIDVSSGGWLEFMEAGPEGRRELDVLSDSAGEEICEVVARALAPLRLKAREGRALQVDSEGLFDLLNLPGPQGITPDLWRNGTPELLRTPIGIGEDGSPTVLDLKESAEGGMGPHGLIVGATGSGKSELLRTLVTGMAVNHSPEDLAMVLVDYKGGATFAGLSHLPHISGMITNIESDLTLVDRMHEALFGELERRQRILQDAGNFDRTRDYQEHRRTDPETTLPPLPSLLVIIDEFGELLASNPDFIDLFVSIGRTGRSLGVHLLLASQRLEIGRLRGLESHLRYRICLRTFSVEESQAVLGVRDAYDLPPLPGLGYLSVDGGLQQFKAALATRPYRDRAGIEMKEAPRVVRAFTVAPTAPDLAVLGEDEAEEESLAAGDTAGAGDTQLKTEMQVVVDRIAELVPPDDGVRQVWLPPLPGVMSLDEVVDPDKMEDRAPNEPGWLEVVIGLKDRPREQLQLPMTLSFTGREGHCAVVGAPRSGKSSLLQTLMASLALTHDPHDVQVYGLDFGGGALHALQDAPHVGAVYGRSERDEINRLVREIGAIIDSRTEMFRRHHIAGMHEFHGKRRAGEIEDDYGEVFLLIDNWALLVQEFEDLQYELAEMAGASLHYGVHFVITSNRWMDIRLNLRDNIGGRVELRLNDPLDSEIDRKIAKTLPDNVPGRGLSRSGEHFQTALPRIDGQADIGGLNAGIEALVRIVTKRWEDSSGAPEIRMLPFLLREDDLPAPERPPRSGVAIGLEEFRLEPVHIDLAGAHPHLLVYGDGECGKSNLLRVLLKGICDRYTPQRVKVAIVDYRRTLSEYVARYENVVAYAYTAEMTTQLAREIAGELRRRMPSASTSLASPVPAQDWTGPHIVLLVDDYDLVAGPGGNPLGDLTEMLAQARDIGFHVVLTRRVSGTARSAYETFYQRITELGSAGIIMNGDPQEGPLLGGQKAQPLAPGRGYLVANRRTALVQTLLAAEGPHVEEEELPGP